MNTHKVVRESKTIMLVTLVIGVALLANGIIFKLLEINLLPNNMAIIALSLIRSSPILCVKFLWSWQRLFELAACVNNKL